MIGDYNYFRGPGGRRFCWDVHPRFRCRLADGDLSTAPELGAAAKAAGVTLGWVLEKAHNSRESRGRDADGRLTNRCFYCDAKMERLGFACWVEEPDDPASSRSQTRERFGLSPFRAVGERIHLPTKREARAWALEQAQIAEAIAAEEREQLTATE